MGASESARAAESGVVQMSDVGGGPDVPASRAATRGRRHLGSLPRLPALGEDRDPGGGRRPRDRHRGADRLEQQLELVERQRHREGARADGGEDGRQRGRRVDHRGRDHDHRGRDHDHGGATTTTEAETTVRARRPRPRRSRRRPSRCRRRRPPRRHQRHHRPSPETTTTEAETTTTEAETTTTEEGDHRPREETTPPKRRHHHRADRSASRWRRQARCSPASRTSRRPGTPRRRGARSVRSPRGRRSTSTGRGADGHIGGNLRVGAVLRGKSGAVTQVALGWLPLADEAEQAAQNTAFNNAFAILVRTVNPGASAERAVGPGLPARHQQHAAAVPDGHVQRRQPRPGALRARGRRGAGPGRPGHHRRRPSRSGSLAGAVAAPAPQWRGWKRRRRRLLVTTNTLTRRPWPRRRSSG